MALPAVGVWNVTDVDLVDEFRFLLDIIPLGPRWYLCVHHLCSAGKDSVGLF